MHILVVISQHFKHYKNKLIIISYKYLVLKKLKIRIEVRIMKLENKILKLSVVGALFFALFGIAWG